MDALPPEESTVDPNSATAWHSVTVTSADGRRKVRVRGQRREHVDMGKMLEAYWNVLCKQMGLSDQARTMFPPSYYREVTERYEAKRLAALSPEKQAAEKAARNQAAVERLKARHQQELERLERRQALADDDEPNS